MSGPLRIAVYPATAGENPFLSILSEALRTHGHDVIGWKDISRKAPTPNVILLNWFENRVVSRHRAWRLVARRRQMKKFNGWISDLHRLRRRGARVIWVAHNRMPHDWCGSERRYRWRTRRLWRQVDAVVHLTEASRQDPAFRHLSDRPSIVLPHPFYPRVTPDVHAAVAGDLERLLFVGGFSARKRADGLILELLERSNLDIVVTVKARKPMERDRAVPAFDRLEVIDGPVSDERLNELFDGRTAAVLADPNALNSGVMLLALSRGAPVFCLPSPTNRELAAELGPEWIRLYDPSDAVASIIMLAVEPVPKQLPRSPSRDAVSGVTGLLGLVEAFERD